MATPNSPLVSVASLSTRLVSISFLFTFSSTKYFLIRLDNAYCLIHTSRVFSLVKTSFRDSRSYSHNIDTLSTFFILYIFGHFFRFWGVNYMEFLELDLRLDWMPAFDCFNSNLMESNVSLLESVWRKLQYFHLVNKYIDIHYM